jgi:hypothetical protein
MHLDKSKSRERWSQMRRLWNEWDPIGVIPAEGGPQDEYEMYLGQTLRLLEGHTALGELERYLAYVTLDRMGLPETPTGKVSRHHFAKRLQEWYTANWPGTSVHATKRTPTTAG